MIHKGSIRMGGWTTLDLYFAYIHNLPIKLQPLRRFMQFLNFIKSLLRSNVVFFLRHGNIKVEPRPLSSSPIHPPLFKALIIYNSFLKFFFRSQDRLIVKPLPCSFIGPRSSFKDI